MSQSFGPLEDASETLFVAEAWKVSGKCAASAREVLFSVRGYAMNEKGAHVIIAKHLLSMPSPDVKFQKQWLRQWAVSTRNAGPWTWRAPHPPVGGTWKGQGVGAPEPSGQELPLPQFRLAHEEVPVGQ